MTLTNEEKRQRKNECQRRYYAKNKENCKEYSKKYKKEHPQTQEQKREHNEYALSYYQRNKQRLREYNKKWRKEWREKNKVHIKEYNKQYRLNNIEKYTERNKQQYYKDIHETWARATICTHDKRKTPITITKKELAAHAKNTTNCTYCNTPLSWGKNKRVKSNSPTIDRINNQGTIDSIWKGGKITMNMGAIVCHSCNCGKGEQTIKEWITRCKNVILNMEKIHAITRTT